MSDKTYLLGVDIGTTSLKAIVFDQSGKIVKSTGQEYKLETPKPRWVECDPEVYWSSLKSCLKEILAEVPAESIKALGVSSQGETIIPIDKHGQPLRKAIVWLDDRAEEEAEAISKSFTKEEVYKITGQPEILPAWPATKILWIKNHEPDVFKQAHKFLLLEDYIIYKLTGQAISDYSIYGSSLMLNITQKKWWGKILKFIGISERQLPRLVESGTSVGKVMVTPLVGRHHGADKETGLSAQTEVVTGGMDQICGMIGANNIKSGIVSETTGGALAICATTGKPVFDPARQLPCHYHAVANTYTLLPYCQTGGMSLKWMRDEFDYADYDQMTEEAKKVPPGCEGVIFLPYLAGAGAPNFNSNARGVFFGLALNTRKPHLVRAILESIGYVLKQNIDALKVLGIKVDKIYALGGGSKSKLWNQIKADITQKPIVTLVTEETACLGAAILAGVGTGLFPSLEKACQTMNRPKDEYLPDKNNMSAYREGYDQYLKVSQTLLPLF